MNKRGNIAIGPGAASLILIAVTLSLSVLGILALMSARADLRLSERSRDVAVSAYALNARAEEILAEMDAAAREGKTDFAAIAGDEAAAEDGAVSFVLSDGGRTLDLSVRLPEGAGRHAVWTRHVLLSGTEEEETEDPFEEDFGGGWAEETEEGEEEWN